MPNPTSALTHPHPNEDGVRVRFRVRVRVRVCVRVFDAVDVAVTFSSRIMGSDQVRAVGHTRYTLLDAQLQEAGHISLRCGL